MTEEAWKDVVGFEDCFMISTNGQLFSKRTNKILNKTLSKTGYYQISTKIGGRNGVCYCFKIHRLVAEAFFPEPTQDLKNSASETVYGKVIVNHIDGDKLNNNLNNLEWSSHILNSHHAISMGLVINKSGLDHPSFILNEDEVKFIQENYIPKSRVFGQRALSRLLNVDRSCISNALKIQPI